MLDVNDKKYLLGLIKKQTLDLLAYPYDMLEQEVVTELIRWLESKGFPMDNPTDLVGSHYVIGWFSDNSKFIIFNFSYTENEQCGGTIVFSLEGKICSYVLDTVECSS